MQWVKANKAMQDVFSAYTPLIIQLEGEGIRCITTVLIHSYRQADGQLEVNAEYGYVNMSGKEKIGFGRVVLG